MKKLVLAVSAMIAFSSGMFAQAPDLMFESWGPAAPPFATIQDPTGWATLNALNLVGTDTSVFKATTAPSQGLISAKIVTVKVVGASIPNPYTSGNIDTAGIMVMGKINISPPGLKYGKPLSGRPAMLNFTSKYTPMSGDSAFVLVYLTRFNGTTRDTIADGKYATGATTATYAAQSITINYKPGFSTAWADTALVFASSSVYNHPGAKVGSTFYVDAMSWSGYTGINEMSAGTQISVYPNPASDVVNFSSSSPASAVELMDITGRKIAEYGMKNNNVSVTTSAFAPGTYLYTIISDKKEVIGRGKFEVVK
jgi:hypothetical protein